jgi:hypothetical protein
MAGNFSMGNRDAIGLPVYLSSRNYIADVHYANTMAQDTGVLTVGDATSPATNATNDTRGTYALSAAANGTNRITINLTLTDIHLGYNAVPYTTATLTGAFGVLPA